MKQAVVQLIRGREDAKERWNDFGVFAFSDDRCQESFNSDQR